MTCTREFTGCEWIFQALEGWLAASGPRFFLLEGLDTWGANGRKCAMLAEALTLFPNAAGLINGLLEKAFALTGGYTRYRALSYLTLAETVRICGLEKRWPTGVILTEAQMAAHNIQHYVFCARITARVTAMQRSWWGEPSSWNLTQLTKTINETGTSPQFAALHIVGETYTCRKQDANTVPLPEVLLKANTLQALAEVYQLPEAELLALNCTNGWSLTTPLDADTEVNIPDPEFAAFVAARLAVEILFAKSVPDEHKVCLIQSLVPVAVRNPTVLDTVLARLLFAAYRSNPQSLADDQLIRELADAVAGGQHLASIAV